MSNWTHISAVIDIDTFTEMSKNNLKKLMEKELEAYPKITGSEGNAEIFVNVLAGHNVYVSKDCDHCCKNEGGSCNNNDKSFKCPNGKYQTRVVITIIGDLRDRLKQQTEEEYNAIIELLNKSYMIRNSSCNIVGD